MNADGMKQKKINHEGHQEHKGFEYKELFVTLVSLVV